MIRDVSKGMVYTSFALLASSVMLILMFVAVAGPENVDDANAIRINEASFFLESALDDLDRTLEMSTRRALGLATDYVVSSGEAMNDPGQNISSALVNGTMHESTADNYSMEDASLKAWNGRIESVADRAGYSLDVEFVSYDFNVSGLIFESNYTVFSRLEDPVTQASFNETHTSDTDVYIDGLEDPMITLRSNEDYISNYNTCSFSGSPVEEFPEADTYSSNTAEGEAVVNPDDASAVSEPANKVLVVQDVDSYMSNEGDFAAVVSAQSNSSTLSNNNYGMDTGSINGIESNMSLIVTSGSIWRISFEQMFKTEDRMGCYAKDEQGPGFIDRLQNKMAPDAGETGIATLVNLEMLPEAEVGRSVVGHVYFDESADPTTCKVRGVSDDYSWFRIDQGHTDESGWNLTELAYDCF